MRSNRGRMHFISIWGIESNHLLLKFSPSDAFVARTPKSFQKEFEKEEIFRQRKMRQREFFLCCCIQRLSLA